MEAVANELARLMIQVGPSNTPTQLSSLQKAMLDATPDCIKVLSVDGDLLAMNRAGCNALGVSTNSNFGMPWLSLLPKEIHPAGLEALQRARAGQHARFPGKSISPDGTIYWDNLLTPVIDASGSLLSILCVSRDITEKTKLERKLEEAANRERLLAREMQHRVKNLFSVVSGLISISEREADAASAPDAAMDILREKLGALSRASDAALAEIDLETDEVGDADLQSLITSVLQPYGDRCAFQGEPMHVRRAIITTLALLLHELATNSVKYGSLSTAEGGIAVRWTSNGQALDLAWTESGGPSIPAPPGRRGFGTEMADRMVRSIGGTIDRTWDRKGLIVDLRLPDFSRSGMSARS